MERQMSLNAERAKSLLVHYFDQAGVVKESDNRAEIEEIVDAVIGIIRAAINSREPRSILELRPHSREAIAIQFTAALAANGGYWREDLPTFPEIVRVGFELTDAFIERRDK